MGTRASEAHADPPGLADVIADKSVRALFDRLIADLGRIHTGVQVQESPVDVRAEFDGTVICRVVPYRELLHVHVGTDPTWEARVRTEAAYVELMERVVGVFLRCVAAPTQDKRLS